MPVDDLKSHAQSGQDFYALLDLAEGATENEIRRAYRRTALKYHPDKHGGSTEAIEKFHLLQIANDVLSDPEAKALYDTAREARRQKLARESAFGERRRKLKEDLERRESGAKRARDEEDIELERREAEIRRLRADGAARLERKRQEMMREMDAKDEQETTTAATQPSAAAGPNRSAAQVSELDRSVKIKWKRTGRGETITKEQVEATFSRFGELDCVVILKDKKKRIDGESDKVVIATALVMFTSIASALAAVEDTVKQVGADELLAALDEVYWAAGTEPDAIRHFREVAPGSAIGIPGLSTEDTTRIRLRLAAQRQKEAKAAKELAQAREEEQKRALDEPLRQQKVAAKVDGDAGQSGLKRVPSFASFKRGAATPQKGSAWSGAGTPVASPALEQLKRNQAREEERRRLAEQVRLEDEAARMDQRGSAAAT